MAMVWVLMAFARDKCLLRLGVYSNKTAAEEEWARLYKEHPMHYETGGGGEVGGGRVLRGGLDTVVQIAVEIVVIAGVQLAEPSVSGGGAIYKD